MESFISAFLAMGLLVIIVLMIYLLDRMNALEKMAQRNTQASAAPEVQAPVAADPWAGLSGKALWDALSGRPPAHLSPNTVDDLRGKYEVVLHKHIQSLFDEGRRDAEFGVSGEPKNPRTLHLGSGPLESWMPMPQANTLYQCGMDAATLPAEEMQAVRQALDEAGQLLFSKVQIPLAEPLSASLLPDLAAPAAGEPNGPNA